MQEAKRDNKTRNSANIYSIDVVLYKLEFEKVNAI